MFTWRRTFNYPYYVIDNGITGLVIIALRVSSEAPVLYVPKHVNHPYI